MWKSSSKMLSNIRGMGLQCGVVKLFKQDVVYYPRNGSAVWCGQAVQSYEGF